MELIAALTAGALIGAVLGFIGAGGAMLSVPILLYIFNFTPQEATTAALAIVFTAATSGLIPKFKNKEVLLREATIIWALGLVTNLGFSLISHNLSELTLTTGFSIVLLAAGTAMLITPIAGSERKIPLAWLIVISLMIGSVTGLFGVGGGFLTIPILVLFFKIPQGKAIGTSLAVISLNSLTAFGGHYLVWQDVEWSTPLTMSISAVIVAPVASIMGRKANQKLLKNGFAFLLFSLALFTLIESWLVN